MFNQIGMLIVFIALAGYGSYHAQSYANEMKAEAYVERRGVITAVSESQRRGDNTGDYDHEQTVQFEYNGWRAHRGDTRQRRFPAGYDRLGYTAID